MTAEMDFTQYMYTCGGQVCAHLIPVVRSSRKRANNLARS